MITQRATIMAVLTMLNLFVISPPVNSKCANVLIIIKGVIVGPQNEALKIVVQVIPDANSGLQPVFPIEDGNLRDPYFLYI